MKTNIFSRFLLWSLTFLCVGLSDSAFALNTDYTIINNGTKYDA